MDSRAEYPHRTLIATRAATGWFVHVFVERAGRAAVEIPPRLRAALERLRPR